MHLDERSDDLDHDDLDSDDPVDDERRNVDADDLVDEDPDDNPDHSAATRESAAGARSHDVGIGPPAAQFKVGFSGAGFELTSSQCMGCTRDL